MRVAAPAKINLHLRVGRKRDDGFHPLLTWMCTIGLFDTLTLIRTSADDAPRQDSGPIALSCDDPSLPTDATNLVVRAATALADTHNRYGEGPVPRREGVSAFLKKRIPVAAGLGGGSSDAAAALVGLNQLWKLDWPRQRLVEFSAQFGSDVPFFLSGPSSICSGRGEIVQPIDPPTARWAMLVLPKIAMSTADVYRRFDEMNLGDDAAMRKAPDWNAWTKLNAQQLLTLLDNDLEQPAFSLQPKLNELRASIESELKRPVRMSGSGSSLFTLFDEPAQAEQAAKLVGERLAVRAIHVQLSAIGAGAA